MGFVDLNWFSKKEDRSLFIANGRFFLFIYFCTFTIHKYLTIKKTQMKKVFLLLVLFFGLEMTACDFDVGTVDQVEMNQMIVGSNVGISIVHVAKMEHRSTNDRSTINQQTKVGTIIHAKYDTKKNLSLFYKNESDNSNRINGSCGGVSLKTT